MSWFGFGGEEKKEVKDGCSEHITINATIEDCKKIIYDYNKYTQFLTDLTEVKVVKESKDGNVHDVHYKVYIMLGYYLEYTLQHSKTNDGLTWTHTKDGPFSHNFGGWKLHEKDGIVNATYTVDCAFNFAVPSMARDYIVTSLHSKI